MTSLRFVVVGVKLYLCQLIGKPKGVSESNRLIRQNLRGTGTTTDTGGVPVPGGVPAQGWGMYLPGLVPPPPPREQNSWHTLMKILPCPKLHLRAAIKARFMIREPIHYKCSCVKRINRTWNAIWKKRDIVLIFATCLINHLPAMVCAAQLWQQTVVLKQVAVVILDDCMCVCFCRQWFLTEQRATPQYEFTMSRSWLRSHRNLGQISLV